MRIIIECLRWRKIGNACEAPRVFGGSWFFLRLITKPRADIQEYSGAAEAPFPPPYPLFYRSSSDLSLLHLADSWKFFIHEQPLSISEMQITDVVASRPPLFVPSSAPRLLSVLIRASHCHSASRTRPLTPRSAVIRHPRAIMAPYDTVIIW